MDGSSGLTGRQAKSRTCQGIRRARPTRRLRPKGSTAETPRNPHRVARGPGPSRGPGGFLGTFSAAKKYPGSGARSPGAIVEEKTGEGIFNAIKKILDQYGNGTIRKLQRNCIKTANDFRIENTVLRLKREYEGLMKISRGTEKLSNNRDNTFGGE